MTNTDNPRKYGETACTSNVLVPDESHLGPAMKALPAARRRFVVALLDTGGTNNTRAAGLAGYGGTEAARKVAGHRLAHHPKVQAAIREEANKRLHSGSILGASVLMEIAANPQHKDRYKAAVELLNRGGLIVETQHRVTVTDERSDDEIKARVVLLAEKFGMDPAKLLGASASSVKTEPDVVDAEFEEVGTDAGLEDLF